MTVDSISGKNTVCDLKEQIEYSEGGIVSKQIVKNTSGNVTLFSFDKGQGLSEHTAAFNAFVQVLEGETEIRIAGFPHLLKAGQAIVMPAHVPHALHAVESFKMLLTMIKV